jgi:hypothetical protein
MVNEDFVYSRIGMALISTQRVEFITEKLLEVLGLYDSTIYSITTEEFLKFSKKSKNGVKTLGVIFKLLKLNPNIVIEKELDDYLKKRNLFIHKFWRVYLNSNTESQAKKAVDFCYDFGKHSQRIERFFKGLTYQLAINSKVKFEAAHKEPEISFATEFNKWFENTIVDWKSDYDYFKKSLKINKLED